MPKLTITDKSHPVRVAVHPGMVIAFPAGMSMAEVEKHVRKMATGDSAPSKRKKQQGVKWSHGNPLAGATLDTSGSRGDL
jgi:hypothetical protein